MWAMRARAVVGLVLLVLSTLLAACKEDTETTKAGDVVKAGQDDQFDGGTSATVVLPTGRLLIHTADPVDSVSADQTRAREAVDAPAGGALVPITWQYDPWASDRLDPIFATTDTPIVEVVADGEHYRVPPPQRESESGESFYVVVDSDAEERSLEIEFDGVVQSVDLTDGTVDEGDAAALYDVEDARLRKTSCDRLDWFDSRKVAADFVCDVVGPVLTPYAAGTWAPEGSLWLALTLTTELGIYQEVDLFGSGARYVARSVRLAAEIDGAPPAYRLSTDDERDQCPVGVTTACAWGAHLVFQVPEDDPEQGPLDVTTSYRLMIANSWGTWDGRERPTVEAAEDIRLWQD